MSCRCFRARSCRARAQGTPSPHRRSLRRVLRPVCQGGGAGRCGARRLTRTTTPRGLENSRKPSWPWWRPMPLAPTPPNASDGSAPCVAQATSACGASCDRRDVDQRRIERPGDHVAQQRRRRRSELRRFDHHAIARREHLDHRPDRQVVADLSGRATYGIAHPRRRECRLFAARPGPRMTRPAQ